MEDGSCPICYQQQPNVILNECKHSICDYCWSRVAYTQKCPMCRSTVTDAISDSYTHSINDKLNIFQRWIDYAQLERKQHQIDGVKWCLQREVNQIGDVGVYGGIIADEMGLGKTIQIIGLMVANIKRHTLIVLPPLLIQQWRDAIYKFTGHKALIFHGTAIKNIDIHKLLASPIVITSYSHIAYKKKKDSDLCIIGMLHKIQWDRVVYDEAHHLRNFKTMTFCGAKMINTKITWLISGTPIHNNIRDIYACFDLLKCKYTPREQLNKSIKNYMLQRTKDDVSLVLPPIREQTIVVNWKCDIERKLAQNIHFDCLESDDELESDDQDLRDISDVVVGNSILTRILRSRQSCISGSLYKKHIVNAVNELDIDGININNMIMGNSKIRGVVDAIVERKDNQRRKLVFCTFRKEIDLIQKMLVENGVSQVVIFDGRVSHKNRASILSNNEVDVLLIQIQTGCEGLNLQHFKEIYFVCAHWNPAVEDQAIARCHRIGQRETVDVFRFTMNDFSQDNKAYDNVIMEIQEKKRKLRSIIYDPDAF